MAEELGLHGLAPARGLRRPGLRLPRARHRARRDGRVLLAGGPVPRERRHRGARDPERRRAPRRSARCCRASRAATTLATLALLEPRAATDADGIAATCASRRAAAGASRGRKSLVLDAQNADLLLVAAREAGSAGDAGVSLFVVRADARGLTVKPVDALDLHAQARRTSSSPTSPRRRSATPAPPAPRSRARSTSPRSRSRRVRRRRRALPRDAPSPTPSRASSSRARSGRSRRSSTSPPR